jgi:predicted HicB family RNase H-like nuclease
MIKYKNYVGCIKFDNEANIYHGEIINTRDVITFQASTVEELNKEFIDSIEDYLDFFLQKDSLESLRI